MMRCRVNVESCAGDLKVKNLKYRGAGNALQFGLFSADVVGNCPAGPVCPQSQRYPCFLAGDHMKRIGTVSGSIDMLV